MGRQRSPIKLRQEVNMYIARFFHPTRMRTERIPLGTSAGVAEKKLNYLNNIFLHPENWSNPPEGYPDVREAWLGPDNVIKLNPGQVKRGETPQQSDADAVAFYMDMAEHWKSEYHSLLTRFNAIVKELEHWRGKKLRTGPSPILNDALKAWLLKYQGRDSDHTKIVGYDLWRFAKAFEGEKLEVDELDGREADIDAWLRSLKTKEKKDAKGNLLKPSRPISAGRRQQIRRIVLRFLEDVGVSIRRKAVTPISRKQVRAGRGAIRWLEREQAEAVAKFLAQPWRDLFLVQVGTGLRPDELVTLKRADFSPDFSQLTLSKLDHLTLKQGSRKLQVPAVVRGIIKARLEVCPVVFPDPETQKPWTDVKDYNKAFNAALNNAGAAAAVPFRLDCRIGRRTCGQLLLRAGRTTDQVAEILGDDPKTVREHYARVLSHEVDPTPAVLTITNDAMQTGTQAVIPAPVDASKSISG